MDNKRKQFIQGFIDRSKTQGLAPQEVDTKLQSALQDFDKQTPPTQPGLLDNISQLPAKVSDVVLGGAKKTAQDIGAGLGLKLHPEFIQSQNQALDMAGSVFQKAQQTNHPRGKAK